VSGAIVVAPTAPATLTLADGSVHSADRAVRAQQARANIVAAKTGAVVRSTKEAKIAAFDAEQVKAGRQMTGEQATRNAQAVQVFADRVAYAKALTPHLDKDGRVKSEIMNSCAPLLHGYKLPVGITVNAQSAYVMLEIARQAGFDQSIVDRFLKAESELGLA
jgi:hypothetical protein